MCLYASNVTSRDDGLEYRPRPREHLEGKICWPWSLLILTYGRAIAHCREYSRRVLVASTFRIDASEFKAGNTLCIIFCCCMYYCLVLVGRVR